jgi:hypothetical protein
VGRPYDCISAVRSGDIGETESFFACNRSFSISSEILFLPLVVCDNTATACFVPLKLGQHVWDTNSLGGSRIAHTHMHQSMDACVLKPKGIHVIFEGLMGISVFRQENKMMAGAHGWSMPARLV